MTMFFQYQNDQVEIPPRLTKQEAVLQAIKDSRTHPLVLNGDGHMQPIAQAQKPAQVTRADVVPFKKHEKPTPLYRPAPAQPLRPAAEISRELTAKLAERLRKHAR